MKTLLVTLVLFFLSTKLLVGQEQKGAIIAVDREIHNFGKILPDNIPGGNLAFTVYNQGDEPLLLTNVRACCGPRVVDYPKAPIAVGDSGKVEVSWRIHPRPHRINRTVTLTSNASNRQTYILRIRGEVVMPEEE